jgi:molybdopterin converting factor subunit 1
MTIDVLLFASYAEALGSDRVTLELASDATTADVLRELRRLPGADRLPARPLVAVNQQYAPGLHPVREGDEVAVIPPVAGG